MSDEMLDEMLDAFDHPVISINKLYNFFENKCHLMRLTKALFVAFPNNI